MSVALPERIQELIERFAQHDWKMLIGGKLTASVSGQTYDTYSPSTLQKLASVPFAGKEDIDLAVEAGQQAFAQWKRLSPQERAAYLRALAEEVAKYTEHFALLDALDGGNPFTAMKNDVKQGTDAMEYFAGLATEVKGQTYPAGGSNWHFTRREPYGVVGRMIPFNHPFMFAASKIAAPLIAGNTIILKAPDQCPLSVLFFGELCQRVLPPGVVNIVTGDGAVTGDAIVRHPGIKRLALIGSVPTGRAIMRSAAETGIKDITLELGGKNAMIVFPDADLVKAVTGAVNGMNFRWTQGQSCGSTSRLFLHKDIKEPFLQMYREELQKIRIGLPIEPDAEMGCLVSERQYRKVLDYVDSAIREGATLFAGGKKPEGERFRSGYFLEPTVFTDVTPDMTIFKEEIFGPVLSVIEWEQTDEVIRMANSLPLGLTGSVWTSNLQRAFTVVDQLEAGFIWINGSSKHFIGVPFQGYKDSGIGTEEGMEEILSYTQIKTVNLMMD